MQDFTNKWTPDLISSNTYMLAQNMGGAEKFIELEALKGALACGVGVIYATNNIDYSFGADEIKKLTEAAGKKMFFLNLSDYDDSIGFNPFLTMNNEQIAQFFFEKTLSENAILNEALSKEPKPITPSTIIKVFHENEALYSALKPVIDSLETAQNSVLALANTDENSNINLRSIMDEGHVLVISTLSHTGYDSQDDLAFINSFINDYFLEPLFNTINLNQEEPKPFYFISSSESALDLSFLTNILTYGRKYKLHACFTDYRTGRSDFESILKIYSFCQNRLWGYQHGKTIDLPILKALQAYNAPSDINKIIFLDQNDCKQTLDIELKPFKINFQKQYPSKSPSQLTGETSMETEVIYAVSSDAAKAIWTRLHQNDQIELGVFSRLWQVDEMGINIFDHNPKK